ncbi:MAG: insulinase family protein, partial [Pyrinomonadaceae bacterium]|nr:insulinase family protein [Pyrinomonadaceae bacterium]
DYFAQDLERYRQVTPADVSRVAKTYLTDKKFVLTVTPKAESKGKMSAPAGGTASIAEIQAAANAGKKKSDTPKTTDADREKLGGLYVAPKPKADPKFALPKIERSKLSNGLEVLLVRETELPLASMNLVIKTGATADDKGKAGIASLTAALIDEGTKTRSATDISNQVQSLGARLGTGAGWDNTSVSMQTLTKNFDQALDIFADVIVNPTFPASELESNRKRLLIALLQRKDNANIIANNAYNALLYGKNHPYGNTVIGDDVSVKSFAPEDVKKFYETYYRPNNAALIVVGNVESKDLMPKLEKAFANWKPSQVAQTTLPVAPSRDKQAVYIVDKPNAAQSVITIGQIGVARDNPDYFPLQVMNSILGGQFISRVNLNLREDKGYTYGARSGFEYRKNAAPFSASAGVQTAVTKESVMEFMKELNGIRGAIPVTPKELEYNKQSLIRRYPAAFETTDQIAAQLSSLVVYGLPDTYFNDYLSKVNAVTISDVNRVANKYLEPSKMAIVIVGDKAVIEPKLKEIEGLEINYLDVDGQPIAAMTNK